MNTLTVKELLAINTKLFFDTIPNDIVSYESGCQKLQDQLSVMLKSPVVKDFCIFWDHDKKDFYYGILVDVRDEYNTFFIYKADNGECYSNCEKIVDSDIKKYLNKMRQKYRYDS
jgi:hypothetical protein